MLYEFADYTLDTQRYELRHAGVLSGIEPQVFDILAYLLAHHDRVVTRQELLEHVWPARFISETTLDHRLMQARQVIGDSGQRQRFIKLSAAVATALWLQYKRGPRPRYWRRQRWLLRLAPRCGAVRG